MAMDFSLDMNFADSRLSMLNVFFIPNGGLYNAIFFGSFGRKEKLFLQCTKSRRDAFRYFKHKFRVNFSV